MTQANKTRIIVIALVIAVLAVFAYAIYYNSTKEVAAPSPHEEINQRADAIENYVRARLAELSPVAPTMGGTFYVTRIRLLDGEGTVNYEDGHMAYVADFTYTITEDNRNVEVTSFTLREDAR
ncbi:MAG TPA: hypothetical protein VEA92_02225 [Candidatus Paceibacterota bacterium]|nr:hypothetical protein [Candidatus Paceibacterota bacterium]